tara:strand:- start:1928 stop:2824 length:897 start_codon:yes stop_codon:yes gene_type:complete
VPTQKFSGIITPVLTPFNDDGSIAEDLYFDHCRHVLGQGSDYISPFGTSGEALSISMTERRDLLEKIIAQNIVRPDQLMPGTGLCALGDTLSLTKHAVELGCAAVMTLPPFFFPNPGDDGLFRYFAKLFEAVGSDTLKICLYHIPQNAGVGISPALANRLNVAFPETVVAYKDSSGNWENTKAVITQAPSVSVFPASETLIPQATALGARGCISATCNVNVAQIKRVFLAAQSNDQAALDADMPSLNRLRTAVQTAGLIPALKSTKAHLTGEKRWLNTRAPLLNAERSIGKELSSLCV